MCTICVVIGWVLIIGIIISFLALGRWTNILRDNVDIGKFLDAAKSLPKYAETPPNKIPRPFSLSRVQLGVWTVVISSSYIFLILCNCCDMTKVIINSTALLLMGISVGTTLVARTIDKNQASLKRHQNEPSEGFLVDILSDENGISIHRFQNVVWTVIAICIYLCYLNVSKCKLPELDSTLIALTGISASAYVGVKINENKTETT
jgi:hypothetical protein